MSKKAHPEWKTLRNLDLTLDHFFPFHYDKYTHQINNSTECTIRYCPLSLLLHTILYEICEQNIDKIWKEILELSVIHGKMNTVRAPLITALYLKLLSNSNRSQIVTVVKYSANSLAYKFFCAQTFFTFHTSFKHFSSCKFDASFLTT